MVLTIVGLWLLMSKNEWLHDLLFKCFGTGRGFWFEMLALLMGVLDACIYYTVGTGKRNAS